MLLLCLCVEEIGHFKESIEDNFSFVRDFHACAGNDAKSHDRISAALDESALVCMRHTDRANKNFKFALHGVSIKQLDKAILFSSQTEI